MTKFSTMSVSYTCFLFRTPLLEFLLLTSNLLLQKVRLWDKALQNSGVGMCKRKRKQWKRLENRPLPHPYSGGLSVHPCVCPFSLNQPSQATKQASHDSDQPSQASNLSSQASDLPSQASNQPSQASNLPSQASNLPS